MVRKSLAQAFEFEHVGLTDVAHGIGFVHGPAQILYHWHREMEVLFILRGSVRLLLDGHTCELGEEDVVLINSDMSHSSTAVSEDALVCGVHLNTGYFERMGLSGFSTRQYQCKTFLHGPAFKRKVAPLKSLIARILLNPAGDNEQVMIREIMCGMLSSYIHRRIPWTEAELGDARLRRSSHERVLRIMNLLNAGGAEEESLGGLAEKEGLTISHLSRLFKAHVGVGFREYMLNCRLDRAVEALRQSDGSISDVMEEVGFGNPAVFYNKFRERFGCTPAKFRQGLQTMSLPGKLSAADRQEVIRRLTPHLAGLGEATQLAIGLPALDGRTVELRAPHRAA
jgi:AraC-like DNA-binding protein